jgi:hypothetical protein
MGWALPDYAHFSVPHTTVYVVACGLFKLVRSALHVYYRKITASSIYVHVPQGCELATCTANADVRRLTEDTSRILHKRKIRRYILCHFWTVSKYQSFIRLLITSRATIDIRDFSSSCTSRFPLHKPAAYSLSFPSCPLNLILPPWLKRLISI